MQELLCGGDDYQLLLSVSPQSAVGLIARAEKLGVCLQEIGHFENGAPSVCAIDENGDELAFPQTGWQHF
jgi:thiamine monophosphate kinase